MKKLICILALLFIGTVTLLPSCSKDDTTPTPTPTTADLIVKVKLSNSTGYLSGADVGIATSKANLDNSVYLKDIVTSASGQSDFGQLIAGIYYYDCDITIAGVEFYGEGQIQIIAGTNSVLTLTLNPK